MIFTVCNKKRSAEENKVSEGPFMYQFDEAVIRSQRAQPTLFASLTSGISNVCMTSRDIDLETRLRGQDSSMQPYCAPCTTGVRDPLQKPELILTVPPMRMQCTDSLASQVTSVVNVPGSGLGRNTVAGKCTPVRMYLADR